MTPCATVSAPVPPASPHGRRRFGGVTQPASGCHQSGSAGCHQWKVWWQLLWPICSVVWYRQQAKAVQADQPGGPPQQARATGPDSTNGAETFEAAMARLAATPRLFSLKAVIRPPEEDLSLEDSKRLAASLANLALVSPRVDAMMRETLAEPTRELTKQWPLVPPAPRREGMVRVPPEVMLMRRRELRARENWGVGDTTMRRWGM